MLRRFLFLLALFYLPAAFADSSRVYQVEKDGVTEFVSKAPSKDAKPAELPKLGHWKVDKSEVAAKATCDTHGGIDCVAGADGDGSVICLDKFKDSLQRFAFECTAAKLTVIQISQLTSSGDFKVTLRNSKAVAARKSSISFKPNRMDEGAKLDGPEQIEGYGIGEFEFHSDGKVRLLSKPKESQLLVTCENCD